MNDIFFSLIIPTYNRALLIGDTLRSVLDQTYSSYEVIVVDDGGNDNTREIIDNLGSEKIKYYKKENGERGAARNFGWKLAQGDYVSFLDSDDLIYNNYFEVACKFIYQENYPTCFAQAYEIRDGHTRVIKTKAYHTAKKTINDKIVSGNFLSCFGVFLKKELLEEVIFEEDRQFAGTEDWLLWLQLAARHPFLFNNEVTGSMIEHDSRSVKGFDEKSLSYRIDHLRKTLENDSFFIPRFGIKAVESVYAHMLSYTSLHLAMSGKRSSALKYLIKSVSINNQEIFTKRSLAIFKKILLP